MKAGDCPALEEVCRREKPPTRALEALDRVRFVSADLGGKRRTAVTTPDAEQLRLFDAVGVGRPKAQEAEFMRL